MSIIYSGLHARVLTPEETLAVSSDELRWLRSQGFLPAIAGGDGEGEGDGDGDGGAGGAGDGDGDGDGDNSGGDGDGDNDHPDDVLEVRRGDYERLRQIGREHEKAEKKRQEEERKAQRDKAIADGRFEEAMKEQAEATATAQRERDEATTALTNERRARRVSDVAKRLGFKDPADAGLFIRPEDGDDDAATERALKKVARSKPYLVESRRPNGLPMGGGSSGGSLLTMEQVQNMSEEEINANWAEVQKVMSGNQ